MGCGAKGPLHLNTLEDTDMSRGRIRNQRRRKTAKAARRLPPGPRGESASSRHYTETGKTFNYNYRINGPTRPVTTTRHQPDCPKWEAHTNTCTC